MIHFIINPLYAAKVLELQWTEGQTFTKYLLENNIPENLLNRILENDKKFLSDISLNHSFYELREDNVLLQALIPINKVMQIHLVKSKKNNKYEFDIIPIAFDKKEYYAKVKMLNDPYTDSLRVVCNKLLAKRLALALKDVLNTKHLKRGSEIDFLYTQSVRAGKPYLRPDIKIVRISTGKKEKFIYIDEEGDSFSQAEKSLAYTVKGKRKVTYSKRVPVSKKDSIFAMPLRHARVTSHFSYSRLHPILNVYRPHHGTDFRARTGTPLLAVNVGKISFSDTLDTYGKVVKIRHVNGYESLYAHLSSIRVKKGDTVKRGQIIGYAGNTGRSTGPHLHFGLKQHGVWIDPMTVLSKKHLKLTRLKKFIKYENVMTQKYRTVEIKNVKENKEKLLRHIKNNTKTHKWDG